MIHQRNQDRCVDHEAGQAHETELEELKKQRIPVSVKPSQMAKVSTWSSEAQFALPCARSAKTMGISTTLAFAFTTTSSNDFPAQRIERLHLQDDHFARP